MKNINISVIGLSGTEKEKGQVGVGKSCLCNRFIRPSADDYFIDHISVLSQTDFSGRIVNNDHFLYWGSVKKCTEEGVEYSFQVIEQTEFIDDSTFQPFKVGKMESYTKRCTALKVISAEKLMYICKNQLGIEKEYEQKVLPEGRLAIDGFLVLFDVSPVPNRSVEKQIEFAHNVIIAILKIKKPLVLVTTKNDDASEAYIREAEKICQRKEYKGLIQIVETSAHESINVDLAFMILAQIIDKVKNRTKLIPYQEAARSRKEILDLRTEAVTRLIRNQVTDYHTLWSKGSKTLARYGEWNEFLNIFGQDAGIKIFRRHLRKLHNDHLNKKLQQYMDKLPCALQKLIPDINLSKRDSEDEWAFSKNYLRNHRDFDQFFLECQEVSWEELDDLDNNENESRIPFDVLETSEAETVFRNYLNSVQQDKKKIGWKQQFKLLLEESGFVTPGKQLCEVRVLFMGRECFEALSEHDCQQIYDIHQDEITEKSKRNFIEMLLEHAQYFLQFKTINIITQEDVRHISDVLQDDSRYKILDRLDQERNIILFQHLDFIHRPSRENCPFYENCIDNLIEDILTEKAGSTIQNKWDYEKTINLLIMGSEHLASDLLNDIRIYTGIKGEYVYEKRTFYLNFRIVNGDIEAFKSVDINSSGLICVYSNMHSFETLKDNLEKTLLCNLELEDKFENMPIVIVFQPHDIKENEIEYLRSEGVRLSEILHCDFIENQQSDQQNYVFEILNIVTLSLKFSDIKIFDTLSSNVIDLRILVCMFCGDQYELENIILPLIAESSLCQSTEHSIIIDVFIGDTKRRVEFILSSYHGINEYNDELIHGFIYFYSCKRRSSLANLSMITSQISNSPSQIIAITECGGAKAFFNSDVSQFLITEGNALADRCKGNFMTFSLDQYIKLAFYSPFLKNVCDNKFDIGNLQADESIALDSGEGTLENSISQLPKPPPRHESYIHSNTLDSHNENYKILAITRSLNSLNEEKDIPLDESYDEHIEKQNLQSPGFRIFPPPTTPPEPAPPDQEMLCTFKNQLISASDSSLEEIASDVSGSQDSSSIQNSGWLDDTRIKNFPGNSDTQTNCNKNMLWNNFRGSKHAFTTGRRHIDSNLSKFRPKGPSQTLKQPGKLNLNNFQLVSEAVARMNFGGDSFLSTIDADKDSKRCTILEHSPLDIEGNGDSRDLVTYEKISKIYVNKDLTESDSCASSADKKMEHYLGYYKSTKKLHSNKKTKKKRICIPVQTPRIPTFGSYVSPPEIPRRFQKISEKENDTLNGSDAKYIDKTSKIELRLKLLQSMTILNVCILGWTLAILGENLLQHSFTPLLKIAPLDKEIISVKYEVDRITERRGTFIWNLQKMRNLYQRKGMKQTFLIMYHHDPEFSANLYPTDTIVDNKQSGKCLKELGKSERRRLKEQSTRLKKLQEKEKDQDKKLKRKLKQNIKGLSDISDKPISSLHGFLMLTGKNNIPVFLVKCVEYIEQEGLDSEGIYRVPGSRAHVELLFQKFEDDLHTDIKNLDIPVNAVATALKDFFSKRLPPLFNKDLIKEIEDISAVSKTLLSSKLNLEVKSDKSSRLIALKTLLEKIPPHNFITLKYVFQHFVHVAENSKLNSMDSKNLAICWWPTLIPIDFTDMGHFEQLRPYLEDIVQTMIDQYPYLFCGKDAFVMV